MTAQVPDNLIYNGVLHALMRNPLGSYDGPSRSRLSFQSPHTANWRGYVATWEIIENALYLVGISGTLSSGESAGMELFLEADSDGNVRASWFSGELRIATGERVNYVHMGYGSTYAQEVFLSIENGIVVSTRLVQNSAERNGQR